MALTKVSSLNSLFSEIYEDARFVARENNIMVNLVRNFSANGWMTRNITERAEATAQEVAEGEDFSNATEFSKTNPADLTPKEYMAQFILTDRMIDNDPDNAQMDASTELGNSIATNIDTNLVGEFTNITTDKGPGAGSSATIATAAAGISVLRNNNAPNPIYAVWHPYHWHKRDCAAAA